MAVINLIARVRSTGVNLHYAWFIVGMATILQLTTNVVSQAFAILLVVMQDNFGWTLTTITLAYFFRSIVGAVLSPVAGWLGDRYGARPAMISGVVLYVAGLLLLSTISQPWQLYLYYCLVLGISQALFRVNIPTTVAAWFKTRLGLAVGLQQSAGGMGSSILAPSLAIMFTKLEWQTAFWLIAAVGGVIILSLLWLFHSDPAWRELGRAHV